MKLLLLLALVVAGVVAAPRGQERIVGGSVTTIGAYPYAVAILLGSGSSFVQRCGGTIINNRSVLSAANCFNAIQAANSRMRLGSTNAHSGGTVYNTQRILNHPSYNRNTLDNDVAVLRSARNFSFNNNVRAGSIAGASYNVRDNAVVWAIGWGDTSYGGFPSEQLRHVQVWTVNQSICASRYSAIRRTITANMLCSGWLDVGGRDQCRGDSGGPLIYKDAVAGHVIVGVSSWGENCGQPQFPGVNARVSRFSAWIINNR